jgi:hypothetical protein
MQVGSERAREGLFPVEQGGLAWKRLGSGPRRHWICSVKDYACPPLLELSCRVFMLTLYPVPQSAPAAVQLSFSKLPHPTEVILMLRSVEQPVTKDVHYLPVRAGCERATQQTSYLLYHK